MELPIRIIIVLFVAVIVGGMIILFSSQVLNKAKEDIGQLGIDTIAQDNIIDLGSGTLSRDEAFVLAQQCVRDNIGSVEETVCYAVFGNAITLTLNEAIGVSDFVVQSSVSGASAVKFVFDPLQTKVTIE